MKIHMTHRQIKELLDLSEGSGDPDCYDDMTLVFVEDDRAHSGPGLYAQFQEIPEEGFMFLGEDEEDQARGDAICTAKLESGEAVEV